MSIAGRVTQAWQRAPWYLYLLWPLTLLYRLITAGRRLGYRSGVLSVQSSAIPVIVVGNLTVGGTGKSPLVASLVHHLQEAGYRPGIVSRGYGARVAHDQPVRVDRHSTAADVGDEPCMLAQMIACPIIVCRDRPRAIKALEQEGCGVVVADDGMQHYRMARDLEICVVDGERGWGNGHLLPMGPLREPLSRLSGVSCLVVNSRGDSDARIRIPDFDEPLRQFAMVLQVGSLEPLKGQNSGRPPRPPERVHALAGIGNPQRFFRALEALGFEVIPHAFSDHHKFVADDLQFDDDLPLIMTAKDAVKCGAFAPPGVWVLPVSAELEPAFYEFVLEQLAHRVAQRQHLGNH